MQRILIIMAAFLMALPQTALAGAIISTGIINIHRADSLWTHGPGTIETLDAAPASEDLLLPFVSIEARFGNRDSAPLGSGFAGGRPAAPYREIYIGAPQSEWGKLGVGLRDYRPGRGTLNGFIHLMPYKEVWENPYTTGVERTTTNSVLYGTKLEWEGIIDSGLAVALTYDAVDVDNDLIGSVEPTLKRDGDTYGIEAEYKFRIGKGLSIEPGLKHLRGDMEGRANSFSSSSASLSIKRFTRKHILNMRLFSTSKDYDEPHPGFGRTRQEDGKGVFAMLLLPGAFGNPNMSAYIGAVYSETDSNINFFDTHQAMVFAAAGFRL